MSGESAKGGGGGGHRPETGPAPKRMRVSRACEQCRSRKAKCDGKTPACSPCVTLSQQCTYGAQPRKRGLPPGSVSALERTVKLLQRVLGLLIVNVEDSEIALLNLVQRCGRGLFDDGDEGDRLSSAWKGGLLPEALEKLREQGQESTERSSTEVAAKTVRDESPSLDLGPTQEHFREAIREISSGERGAVAVAVAGGRSVEEPRSSARDGNIERQQVEGSREKDEDGEGDGEGDEGDGDGDGDGEGGEREGGGDGDGDGDGDGLGTGPVIGVGNEAKMDWVKDSPSLQETHRVTAMERRQQENGILNDTVLSSNIDSSLLMNDIGIQYQSHIQSRTLSPPLHSHSHSHSNSNSHPHPHPHPHSHLHSNSAIPPSNIPTTTTFPSIDSSDVISFPDHPTSHSSIPNHQPLFNPPTQNQSFCPISYQQSPLPLNPSASDSYSLLFRENLPEDHIQLPSNSRLLLDLYFTYTHVWFPILDKYDLIRLFHVVSSSSYPAKRKAHSSKTKVPAGKRALLYAVLALATIQHQGLSQPPSPPEPTSPQQSSSISPSSSPAASALYTTAQQLVFSPGEEYSLEHVQALLLLSVINTSLSHLSTAWLLVGHAGRVAVDIRLRSETNSRFNTRTWLGYLVLETFMAVQLGREPGVREGDWNAPAIGEDGWEEWDSWKEVAAAELQQKEGADRNHGDGQDSDDPAHILSAFNQLVELSRLVRRVAGLSLPAPSHQRSSHHGHNRSASNEDLSAPQTILRQLYSWNRELPPQFSFDILNREMSSPVPTIPHISNLHLYYAHAILELYSRCPPRLFRDSFNGMSDLAPAAASSTATILEHVRSSRSLAVLPCTFSHFASSTSNMTTDGEFSPLGPLEKSVSERVRALKDELETQRHLATVGFVPSNGLFKKAEAKLEPPWQVGLHEPNLTPPHPPQPRKLLDTRSRPMSQPENTSFTGQLVAMSPLQLFTFTPPASMISPTSNIPAPESNMNSHLRHPSAFSVSGIDPPPNNPQSQQVHCTSSMTGGNMPTISRNDPGNTGGNTGINTYTVGTASSLSISQTAPSPDGFDEEMGMLECLPWNQNGIPEFIKNLGYVGGFSPTAFQLGTAHEPEQVSLPMLGLRENNTDTHGGEGGGDAGYDGGVGGGGGGGGGPGGGDEAGNMSGRRGLNTVLEQWLGDVLGASGSERW